MGWTLFIAGLLVGFFLAMEIVVTLIMLRAERDKHLKKPGHAEQGLQHCSNHHDSDANAC